MYFILFQSTRPSSSNFSMKNADKINLSACNQQQLTHYLANYHKESITAKQRLPFVFAKPGAKKVHHFPASAFFQDGNKGKCLCYFGRMRMSAF